MNSLDDHEPIVDHSGMLCLDIIKSGDRCWVIGVYRGRVCVVDSPQRKDHALFVQKIAHRLDTKIVEKPTSESIQTKRLLDLYFSRKAVLPSPHIPTLWVGTRWQRQVWKAVCSIPYGEVRSYRDLACQLGRRSAVRAVARAVASNPLALLIPCHRVIGSDRSLRGYAHGLSLKRQLLLLEGVRDLPSS